MIRQHRAAPSLQPHRFRSLQSLVGIPLHLLLTAGIAIFTLLLAAQIFLFAPDDEAQLAQAQAEIQTEEPAVLGVFRQWQRPQVRMPIPSGNPTPLPTLTPTPTNTPTPTPTPTNTPTPSPTPLPTSTPTPTPDLPPPPAPAEIDGFFTRYSGEYGVEEDKLRKIAACESGYNATSHNTTYDYAGMFQFSRPTWQSTRMQMGADPNPDLRFDAEQSIRTAAFKISRGGEAAWPSCL
jgi:hypothetical protein